MLKFLLFFVALTLLSSSSASPVGKKELDSSNNEEEVVMPEVVMQEKTPSELAVSKLNLPSNATSIRADITDSEFSCENKSYGYYADIENECQIFHVCLPVTYADGKSSLFRWSFICPEETIFSQDSFTCMRSEDMLITCEESAKYFELNGNFGMPMEEQSEMKEAEKVSPSNGAIMEPAKPIASEPAKPIASEPAKPTASEPAKPTASEPSKPIASEPAKQIASEPTKPTETPNKPTNEIRQRRPVTNKVHQSEIKKHVNLVTEIKKADAILKEELQQTIPIKEELQQTTPIKEELQQTIPKIEPIVLPVTEIKETVNNEDNDIPNAEVLQDTSGETDIVSALINSLTEDSEPSDDDAQIIQKEDEEQKHIEVAPVIEEVPAIEEDSSPSVIRQEELNTPILSNEAPVEQSVIPSSDYLIPSLSIDDVIGLVKESLDNNQEVSAVEEVSEPIKPIYQRNDETNNDSKIIVISKMNEGVEPINVESTDSKIIPVEIKESIPEVSDSIKTKSRRHLMLSSRGKF